MTNLDAMLALYDYTLPEALIAKEPVHPRDSAKLLIYDRFNGTVRFDVFANIAKALPENAVLVFNQTKVIPARMELTKETGGAVSALYLTTEGRNIRALASGHLKAGDVLRWEGGHTFTVMERHEKEVILDPSFPVGDMLKLLRQFGHMPLPPYMKDSPLSEEERRTEYQTVYAKEEGSVAAPTAGLHFTKELITKLEQHGCAIRYVTLHVGLGTFAPLTEEHLQKQQLHHEHYEIDEDTAKFLNNAKAQHRPVIAVGTTVVRTLEAASASMDHTKLLELSGTTSLFLSPDNPPKFVDHLVTNFHVPRSSLMMLVAAFTGREKLLELYRQAIAHEFRFFSFGDGMLVL